MQPVRSRSADTDGDAGECLYVLVESEALPTVDLSHSIRSVFFTRAAAARFSSFSRKYYKVLHTSFFIGALIGSIAWFQRAPLARMLAAIAAVLVSLGTATNFTLLRFDVIRVLTRTYEFWFFTLVSIASSVLLALHFSDTRAFIVPSLLVGTMNTILIDANIVVLRQFIMASLCVVFFMVIMLVYFAFHMVDEAWEFTLFRVHSRTLSVQNALVNGWGTIVVLICRNVYRRRAALKKLGTHSSVTQCIFYRCRLKLVPVGATRRFCGATSPTPSLRRLSESRPPSPSPVAALHNTPMYFAKADTVFDAKSTVLPSMQALLRRQCDASLFLVAFRVLLYAFAIASVVLCMVSFFAADCRLTLQIQIGAFACTCVFCGFCFGLHQRQLLSRLVFSFDFAFLSIQLTFVHLCACDLVYWDGRCFAILSSWLWIHWVLAIDALTPQVKHKLRFRTGFATPIMVLFILSQIFVAVEILFDGQTQLQDRVVFEYELTADRKLQFRVVPSLLSRLVTLLGWSCRIQWRLWTSNEHDLVVIQGNVTYERSKQSQRSRKSSQAAPRKGCSVVPTRAGST